MVYLDTSFVGPLFVQEDSSAAVLAWLDRQDATVLMISDWSVVEFSSSLARRVRMRTLSPGQADAAFDQFAIWRDGRCEMVSPDQVDFEFAATAIRHYKTGLRSGDALHLAMARNNAIPQIATLDFGMARAARMLGLDVATL